MTQKHFLPSNLAKLTLTSCQGLSDCAHPPDTQPGLLSLTLNPLNIVFSLGFPAPFRPFCLHCQSLVQVTTVLPQACTGLSVLTLVEPKTVRVEVGLVNVA